MQKWQSIMQADLGVDLLLFCFFEFIGQAGIYKSESTAGEEMELWGMLPWVLIEVVMAFPSFLGN